MRNIITFPVSTRMFVSKHLISIMMVMLSLVIRFGASLVLTNLDAMPRHDGWIFTRIAWNLVSGNGYSANGEIPTAWRPPGYPFLLAGVFSIFGQSWAAARVVNILLSAFTVVIIYLIGCRLFNGKLGLIAALISALYPPFIKYPLRIISDTLFVFLISIILFVFIRIYDRPNSLGTKLVCGVLLGLAILTRSELLLFIPFLLVWALLSYRQFYTALRAFLIISLPVLLCVLPWLIRNYFVFDGVVMATNLGRVMWGVYNPDTFADSSLMGGWHPPKLDIENAGSVPFNSRDRAYHYLPEPEWNQQHIKLAVESIKRNVRLLPRMGIYKLHRLIFSPGPVGNFVRSTILYCFFFGLILLLASGDKRFMIFYLLILFVVFSTLVFYTNERLRMIIDPTLILIASYGLGEQIKLVRQKREKRGRAF